MLSFFALLAGVAIGQHRGDVPPDLVWEKVRGHCPPSLDWPSLHGNVVVISLDGDALFPEDVTDWAASSRKFQGKPIVFLRIIAGSEFLVDQALRKAAYTGCILLDSHEANRRNFKFTSIPRTVVIDQLGVIAGYSWGPDERGILAVLDHEQETGLSEVPEEPQPYNPRAGADSFPFFEVQFSLAPPDGLRALDQGGPHFYISKQQPLKALILDLWDTPTARTSYPENLDQRNYDVTARLPFADRDLLRRLVRKAFETKFGLGIAREVLMQRVYLLTADPAPSPEMQPAREDDIEMSGLGQASLIGMAQAMQDVARALEGLLNVPVIDETGLKGRYNYSVSSKLSEAEAVFDFAHQLGLELTPAERPIEVLVVRKTRE